VAEYDAVIVGSGVNSLACGALLARGGWRVCVLERSDWLGGAIHTAEITELAKKYVAIVQQARQGEQVPAIMAGK